MEVAADVDEVVLDVLESNDVSGAVVPVVEFVDAATMDGFFAVSPSEPPCLRFFVRG